MKPCSSRMVPFFVLLAALSASCSQNPSRPDPDRIPTLSASQSAGSKPQSVITVVEEADINADGVFEGRFTTTTWYDAHGNRVRVLHRAEGALVPRVVVMDATLECTPHGTEVSALQKIDEGDDGTIDDITSLTTLEFDQRGNPRVQELASDTNADGKIDAKREWVNEFNARGRVIKQASGSGDFELGYDAHGNLTRYLYRELNGPHTVLQWEREYTTHNALIRSTESFDSDRSRPQLTSLITTKSDAQGYPTRQITTITAPATPAHRTTIAITYDGHHNVAVATYEHDFQSNGVIDGRTVIHYEYSRPEEARSVGRGSVGHRALGLERLPGLEAGYSRPERAAAVLER